MTKITLSDLSSPRTEIRIGDLLSSNSSSIRRLNSKVNVELKGEQIVVKAGGDEYQYRSKTWAKKRITRLVAVYELRD
jgi:hypothetical protein